MNEDSAHRHRSADEPESAGDGNRPPTRQVPNDPVQRPSPEELQRLVASHLSRGPSRRTRPLWLLRLISAAIAVLVLLLLFALLPESR